MRRIAGSSLPSTMRWVSSEKSSGSTSGSGDSGESGIGRIRSKGGEEAAAIAGVAIGGEGAGGGGVSGDSGNATMNNHEAYGWLEQPRHDPIATDTNLAEIDFEDFRNEDLAYAFSCGVSQRMHSFSHLNTLKVLIPLRFAM